MNQVRNNVSRKAFNKNTTNIGEIISMHERFKKGDFIGEQYEVYDLLGEGGFGTVYLVYSHVTKEAYALKTCRDEYIEDATIRVRFRKEAQVWIDLERHPFIVRAYLVESISGRLYIAMDHIAADESGLNTLEGFLRNRPPDLAQSLRWAIQFCHGMEHAYSRGIKAHRDIKPANIMIDTNKSVKITDFGLAGIYVENAISKQNKVPIKISTDISMQTAIGTSVGTPEYMSPEQFDDLSSCDERSDIYSFGIVLFQMASGGKLPFKADNPAYRWAALKHYHQESIVPRLTSPLYSIICRCLEKKLGKRYQTFKELRVVLEPLLKKETGEIINLPELKEMGAWELVSKGYSLASLGKDQEAIACYNSALEINPKNAEAWCNKGNSFKRLRKDQEAITCYDRALEINPREAVIWCNKGASFASLGKDQDAIAYYDRALAVDSKNVWAWVNKGLALGSLGKDQEAIACYDRALEINFIDAVQEVVWCHKGALLGSNGKDQEAIACYDRALEINPMHAVVWGNKGFSLGRLGRDNEAIACYDKALEVDPRYTWAWINKGALLESNGKDQDAIGCYDRALEIDPKDALAWYNKGHVLGHFGKYQDAIACHDRALEINPRYAQAWSDKGFSMGRLGKVHEAIACYDKALEIDPRYAWVWFSKGIMLGSLDKKQEAIVCFDRALEINPRDVNAWYSKGVEEDKLNRTKEAIISYKKFLKLSPNHDDAASVFKRIETLEEFTFN